MKVITSGKHHSDWQATVVCDQDGGCEAVLEVMKDDVFTDSFRNNDTGTTTTQACCFCLSCGNTLWLGDPRAFGKLPNRKNWVEAHPVETSQVAAASHQRDKALGIPRGYMIG